ncbi:MAG: hypothetical protein KF822_03060 [Steroidobacteraceae bacterium]|nr:hypothetical protein [Steroidobacteraceae bacterium]
MIHRNGMVEFDDPDTGRHVVMMEGLTVESGDNDALAIVSVATVITCGSCLRRWIMPIANYRQGWHSCPHCAANLFMPPIYGEASAGQAGAVLPLCGHEFPPPENGS